MKTPLLILLLALPLVACQGPATGADAPAVRSPADDPVAEGRVGLARRVPVTPRPDATGPRLLAVVAHPDDEIAFAGTLYKTTVALDGACDVVTITNGEGGYRYAVLAERLYDLPLTDEAVGRAELPAIRQRELSEGLAYMAVRDLYMLDQQDHRYTTDEAEILDGAIWDLAGVTDTLERILRAGDYDAVLTHFPRAGTHGHHKSATILTLQAWQRLPEGARPAPLGVRFSTTDDGDLDGLEGWPLTAARRDVGPWRFDRMRPFGHDDRLDYRVIANWAIGAHKSQGTMQLLVNRGEYEDYWLYAAGADADARRAAALFTALDAAPDPGDDVPGDIDIDLGDETDADG